MTVLSPVRSIFRAVVSTVVPEAKELGDPGWSELEMLVETTLQNRPRAMHRQLRLFLRAIQWLPVFRYGKRFTSLSAEQRMRILCTLQDHRVEVIRCGFWGLRTLALLGYYGRPAGVQATGYAADPRGWEALR
jgi:Gluconate 2-dehydrogenase subunit 3